MLLTPDWRELADARGQACPLLQRLQAAVQQRGVLFWLRVLSCSWRCWSVRAPQAAGSSMACSASRTCRANLSWVHISTAAATPWAAAVGRPLPRLETRVSATQADVPVASRRLVGAHGAEGRTICQVSCSPACPANAAQVCSNAPHDPQGLLLQQAGVRIVLQGARHLFEELDGLVQQVDAVRLQEVAEVLVQARIGRRQPRPDVLVCGDAPQVPCVIAVFCLDGIWACESLGRARRRLHRRTG